MIFAIDNFTEQKQTVVYDNISDLTSRVEWQDIQDTGVIIIDEEGNIYNWDETKKEEISTTYDYTMKIVGSNKKLGHSCFITYKRLHEPTEFDLIGS